MPISTLRRHLGRRGHRRSTAALLFLSLVLSGGRSAGAAPPQLPDDGDGSAVFAAVVRGSLMCGAAWLYAEAMPRRAIYSTATGRCEPTGDLLGVRYKDPFCTAAIETFSESLWGYCYKINRAAALGDAAALRNAAQRWGSSYGTTLSVTLPGLHNRWQPYLSRQRYRTTVREDLGECALEMRIYSPHPNARDLAPAIAFHGGSWSGRRTGFIGLESMVSHLTDRGLLVFAPFYRLVGDSEEAPAPCTGARAEALLNDAEAALQWVLEHGANFGASDAAPRLFGQSAGAYLAGMLAAAQPGQVAGALLMYPPSDLVDFAARVGAGREPSARAIAVIEGFLGEPAERWPLAPDRLRRLSLSESVAALDRDAVPPMRIVHGRADGLVPPRQSRLLCAALGAERDWRALRDEAGDILPLQATTHCGEHSQLVLLEGAGHALEACISDTLCQAGDRSAQHRASAALREAYDWLAGLPEPEPASGHSAGEAAGAGGTSAALVATRAASVRQ